MWLTLAGCGGGERVPEDEGDARGTDVTGTRDDAGRGRDGSVRDAGAGLRDAGSYASRDAAAASADAAQSEACGVLRARVRDFKQEHGDFEDLVNGRVVTGLVADRLGTDGKPQIQESLAEREGIHSFDEWYTDVPEVNQGFDVELTLVEQADGKQVFDSDAFFPLDDKGFGNQYYQHNYHFTTEIRTRFVYRGGEDFTFAGDDDVWVFINGRLAIDLGGVHGRESATVDLDAKREALGIEVGGEYTMDIFHAERHVTGSNFRIETTIECITPVVAI